MPKNSAKFSPHCEARKKGIKVDTVIIHSMYSPKSRRPLALKSCVEILNFFGVSAHYLISRRGKILNLVPEEKTAWHAGVSCLPDGRTKVNRYSIGIELIGFEHTKFTASQYLSLLKLLKAIRARHPIRYILGHDFIARPKGRKQDPGILFDWGRVRRSMSKIKPPIHFPPH